MLRGYTFGPQVEAKLPIFCRKADQSVVAKQPGSIEQTPF
jgi:hypothetical protein